MQSLVNLPGEVARSVRAVLTDIDDTLTVDGRLPALAYKSLERLEANGIVVIPVTGRPAGWCDLIARQWPVSAVVGENGAFWFRYDHANHRMIRRFSRTEAERRDDKARLDRIATEVLDTVPGAAISADQPFRMTDLAIDFCEDVPRLPRPAVAKIVSIFEVHGAIAKVSSIHVNGWYGTHDKLTCSLELLRDQFGIDATANRGSVVFAGDSPNDAPMFAHFPNSVGVANVVDFADQIATLPGYVTRRRSASGFRELTNCLLEARRGTSGGVAAADVLG
jgi:HAD superfamily hydrolase (TIGR01484 family)